jgi:hypothetical protein
VRLASLLVSFDDAWLEYLDQFVVWKGHDARSLEEELLRMAVRLERSVRLKLGRREPDGPEVANNPDLKAMMAHVRHDHALLAERISRLTGADGSARLAAALDHVRAQVAAELTAAEAEEAAAAAAEENEESDKVTGTRCALHSLAFVLAGAHVTDVRSSKRGHQVMHASRLPMPWLLCAFHSLGLLVRVLHSWAARRQCRADRSAGSCAMRAMPALLPAAAFAAVGLMIAMFSIPRARYVAAQLLRCGPVYLLPAGCLRSTHPHQPTTLSPASPTHAASQATRIAQHFSQHQPARSHWRC